MNNCLPRSTGPSALAVAYRRKRPEAELVNRPDFAGFIQKPTFKQIGI
jgi:hypothetical protein